MFSEDRFISPHPLPGQGQFRAGRTVGQDHWGGPLSMRQGREKRRKVRSTTHLPRGLDAFPDAEETDQPHEKKAESKVPLQ